MVWITYAIKYRHFLGYGLVVAALAFTVWYIHHQGYRACTQDQIVKEATIAEKRNDIANKRPDTERFLDGLLNDAEW